MKAILTASLALLALCSSALAQAPGGAEARLKSLNITLPPDTAPAANFVNSVQSGKLLFLSGNTAGPAWVGKGKLGKDLTVEQGREAARQAGLIMLTKRNFTPLPANRLFLLGVARWCSHNISQIIIDTAESE
jgi:hypothetical protein